MKFQPANSAIFRLSAYIAAAILASSLIAMLVIYAVMATHLDKSLKTLIETDMRGYTELYAQRRIIAVRQAFERRAKSADPLQEVYLLLNKKGTKLGGNLERWPKGLPQNKSWQKFALNSAQSALRSYLGSIAVLPGGFAILVARSTKPNEDALLQMRWAIGLSILAVAAISSLLGWVLSNRILGRISAINSVCDKIESGDLSARVKDKSQDEFGVLADHINNMLERISSLMRGTREVSDRIAHELRTPLNRILLRVESIQEGPLDTKIAAELSEVSGDLNETIEVFEALLDIAEAEVGVHDNASFEPVDLSLVAKDILSLYQVVADEKQIEITIDARQPTFILGDKNLLARAIANLLDNALKYSPANGQVSINLTAGEHFHRIEIKDNGPGLDGDLEGKVFERFSRGRNVAEVPGHGLGLAIVQAIAIRHGIKILLSDNDPGLCIAMKCPAYHHLAEVR